MFRIPVSKLDEVVPLWEQIAWEQVFDVYGPLDWRRNDYLDAREIYSRCGKEGDSYEDYTLFSEPRPPQTMEEIEQMIMGD